MEEVRKVKGVGGWSVWIDSPPELASIRTKQLEPPGRGKQ